MLKWIKGWFTEKQEQPVQTPAPVTTDITDVGNLYSLQERSIYGYFRGEKDTNDEPVIVWTDPLAMWKKLMEHGPELSVRMKVAFSPSKGNVQAHTELVKQIRDAFGIKPFEEGGLTEAECVYLLDHFLTYIGTIKKNSSEPPTPPEEETSPTSVSPSEDFPITKSGSDLNSTTNEGGCDTQALSPSAPESPSEQ